MRKAVTETLDLPQQLDEAKQANQELKAASKVRACGN
jgi:hypothetical protein